MRDVVEAGVEDGVVDAADCGAAGQPARRRAVAAATARQGSDGTEHRDATQRTERDRRTLARRRRPVDQVMLVRSRCFSAWRSRASAISRSSSAGYGSPDASHIFGYMLIVVKPGMVLTSFRYSVAGVAVEQEVDARHARHLDRPERLDREPPDRRAVSGGQRRGNQQRASPASRYFAS